MLWSCCSFLYIQCVCSITVMVMMTTVILKNCSLDDLITVFTSALNQGQYKYN